MILPLLLLVAQTAPPVTYEVGFPNAAHHEAEITVTFSGLSDAPLEVWMSRGSPGRYAVHEFAKNVYSVRATDGRGRTLTAEPDTPYSWKVAGHDRTVQIRYTLFGDRGDGTYAQISRANVHLNAPATFLWARGLEQRPVRVTFAGLPDDWRIATQLKPTSSPLSFTAPNLQLLLDSPITIGRLDLRTWLVTNGPRVDTMRVAINHLGTSQEVDRYVVMTKKIVQEQAGILAVCPDGGGQQGVFLGKGLVADGGINRKLVEHLRARTLGERPAQRDLQAAEGEFEDCHPPFLRVQDRVAGVGSACFAGGQHGAEDAAGLVQEVLVGIAVRLLVGHGGRIHPA